MIHYQLLCGEKHEFDGWFKDSAGFERQAKRGLVECPHCGDTKIVRAPMAPAVSTREAKSKRVEEAAPAPPPSQPHPVSVAGRMPAHVFALLRQMRREVEKNCDYVGADFADEARKIHRGETDARGIYGETTPDDAAALADEGIEISSLPWVPHADG